MQVVVTAETGSEAAEQATEEEQWGIAERALDEPMESIPFLLHTKPDR